MSFTTSKITSVEVLDRLLAKAQLDKITNESQLANLVFSRNQMDLEEQNALLEQQAVQSELDLLNAQIPTLSEGEYKAAQQDKATRTQYRLFQVNSRLKRYGGEAMVTNEYEQIERTAKSVDLDTYISALQTRRAELAP